MSASLNILVNSKGVDRVQFCGDGWSDETEALRLYFLLRPLIQQMDLLVQQSPKTENSS